MTAHRIILFDIDGTLVTTGGAGAVAWRRAFQELHGIPADIGEYTDAGMTDPDVGAKTFEAVLHREPTPRRACPARPATARAPSRGGGGEQGLRVLPGVPERLSQFSRDGHLLGIITGNGDGAAPIKLSRGDLNRWFSFGAYATAGRGSRGDRAPGRRAAARRSSAVDVPNTEIFVVGDTPLDIEAAHAAGCTAIGVATGKFDAAALREAGADDVLETLEEPFPF